MDLLAAWIKRPEPDHFEDELSDFFDELDSLSASRPVPDADVADMLDRIESALKG